MTTRSWIGNWAGSSGPGAKATTAANLATAFTPTQPMCAPGTQADQLVVLLDVPEKLQQALDAGMPKIGPACLHENAEVVLRVYEDICLQHVIDNQIPDKTLKERTPRWRKRTQIAKERWRSKAESPSQA